MEKSLYKHEVMEDWGKLLVYELSENLRREQIELLSSRNENAKNILIYDYLSESDAGINLSKSPLLEQIIHARYDKVSPDEKRYFKFKTPKKELVIRQYRKNLSDYLSDKFPKLETKKELKQLYCLDEIYSQLNQNRKEKIDFSNNLPSVINSSIELYNNQLIARQIGFEIGKFWDLAIKVDYSKLSLEQVEYLKSHAKIITEYANKKSQDFEIRERIADAKKAIEELNRKINEGIEDSIRDSKEYFKNVDKKNLMSFEEFLGLKSNQVKLSKIEKILAYLDDPRASEVPVELKKHSELTEEYTYFCNHKDELESIIEKQRKMNKRINKTALRGTFSLFESFRRNKIEEYITRTEKNLSDFKIFYENRYLKKIFDDKREGLNKDFRSLEIKKNWSETLSIQTKKLVTEDSWGYFWRGRIKSITNLLDKANQFEDRLKADFFL